VYPEVKVERNRAKDDQFTYAKKLCRRLNYKDSFDYINQNGIQKFREEITPQIINALNNGTIKNAR
jgi:mannitol-1-phosphate/altronate dehydrogenase